MTLDPHSAERFILIGCKDAHSRKHALRLYLDEREREIWLDLATKFLSDTVKYDSTSCAVFVEPRYQLWPEALAVVRLTQEHYKQARINQNTVEMIGEAQGRNFIRNLRQLDQRPMAFRDARALRARIAGKTTLVIGAGPSLDQCAELVREHQGPIIAVNTSAGACAHHGIIPDAVLCTESKLVREGIDRMDKANSRLAMDLICHPGNWLEDAELTGPQLCFVGTEPNLAPYAQRLELLPLAYGSSCTTAAVSLALACGAARVALVGQDCAFAVKSSRDYPPIVHARMYAAGTPYERTQVTINTQTMRALVQKPTVPSHEIDVVLAEGTDDNKVWTTHAMLSFAHWFQQQPEDVRARIVNCTALGARIEGVAEQPLAEVLDRSAQDRPVIKSAFGLHDGLTTQAGNVLRHLKNAAETGAKVRSDANLLGWARKHPIVNMWTGPERLRMRRMPELSSAERGHRVAETIRTACREIVACAKGEL
jgi:hypothetical protein